MNNRSQRATNWIGRILLGGILATLAYVVLGTAFFPHILPSTEKYPSMDPTYTAPKN